MAIEAPALVVKLLPYIYSLVSVALNGEIAHDQGVVELSAQHPHEITELGRYPVAELTPDEKAHGLTAVEKSFGYDKDHNLTEGINDYDTDVSNDSRGMKAARATLMAEGLSGDELEQAMDQVRAHIKDFIAASHHTTIGDPTKPFSQNGVTDVYIKDGKMIMADGSLTAKEVTLKLPEPAEASQLKLTTTDAQGTQHVRNFTIFDTCANSAIKEVVPEQVVVAAPAAQTDTCEHGWRPKVITSEQGIDIDGRGPLPPQHEVTVNEAPSDLDVNQALEDLQKRIESGEIKIPDDGQSRKFILWVDQNCDGTPENIECVTIVRHGTEVSYHVEEIKVTTVRGLEIYDALTPEEKEKWVKTP